MFLGEYQHSLDAKGRIILPSKFRAPLAQGCVLTKGQDQCLYVYPPEEWVRVTERLKDIKVSGRQPRRITRVLFSGASEQVPDKQGRVLVPEPLRVYAALPAGAEATIIGAGGRIEVWERSHWTGYLAEAEREFSELAESDPDLPL